MDDCPGGGLPITSMDRMISWQEVKKKSLDLLQGKFEVRESNAMVRILHEDLLMGHTGPMHNHELLAWYQAIDRLLNDEPIAYITGVVYFLHLKLTVGRGVLIPRPETQELASLAIQYIRSAITSNEFKVLDIGTGSGCLALAIKSKYKDVHVSAIDISDQALQIAKDNANRLKLHIEFDQIDILKPQDWGLLSPKFDMIISNPPYIQASEREYMSSSTLKYEPELALFSSGDPLKFYKAIATFGKERLKQNGIIFVEINEYLSGETITVFEEYGFRNVRLIKDLSGKDRILRVTN